MNSFGLGLSFFLLGLCSLIVAATLFVVAWWFTEGVQNQLTLKKASLLINALGYALFIVPSLIFDVSYLAALFGAVGILNLYLVHKIDKEFKKNKEMLQKWADSLLKKQKND